MRGGRMEWEDVALRLRWCLDNNGDSGLVRVDLVYRNLR